MGGLLSKVPLQNRLRGSRGGDIGEYLDIVVRQLPPHRCGSAEAVVLPRLSEHLVPDSFRCAERPENRNQETFLVDG